MPRQTTALYEVFAGADSPGHVFRVTQRCPPSTDDFRSYEAVGRAYDRREFFRGTGVSMYTTASRAIAVARRFALGKAVATLDLRREGIVWSRTGARGHITVWAPPELLLACVVQCESHER